MSIEISRRRMITCAVKAVAATATGGLAVRIGIADSHSDLGSSAHQVVLTNTHTALPQQFTSPSIWSQPIGSSADYVPAGLDPTPATHSAMPHSLPRPSIADGALRVGEMRPGITGPAHALSLVIAACRYLFHAATEADTFRWPATSSSPHSVGYHGSFTGNQNTAMKLGVLLAIRPSSTLPSTLRTEPGRQIAWTLQNYGGYVTDAAGDDFLICTEEHPTGSFIGQFRSDWGFAFDQRANMASHWVLDIEDILRELCAVNNNSPTSVGGGGTPRRPMATPSG